MHEQDIGFFAPEYQTILGKRSKSLYIKNFGKHGGLVVIMLVSGSASCYRD